WSQARRRFQALPERGRLGRRKSQARCRPTFRWPRGGTPLEVRSFLRPPSQERQHQGILPGACRQRFASVPVPAGRTQLYFRPASQTEMIIISQDLVAQVRHAWISDQQNPQRERRERPIPDSERLGMLLDIVFRTSMMPEEGRHVRANVAWLSMEDFREHELKRARRSELALKFERPTPLDPAVLAKLGRTTESGSSSLLVDWFDEDDDVPMIWGMIYYVRARRAL